MAYSMTGFGSAQLSRDGWQCQIEIRSVNSRFLDSRIKLPTGFQNLEQSLNQTIKEHCSRGKVDCTINLQNTE
ncbi:MAG: YicC family protein, partial [SAR324 cluster bacterium]|nr:YicC family protein [SAR324 cluster bacterium]